MPAETAADFFVFKDRLKFMYAAALAAVSKADLFVICHVNLIPLAGLVRLFRPRLPILLFVHGIEVWIDPPDRRKHWSERLFFAAVTEIAAVSAYTARKMAEDFGLPRSKFRLLPNAVDQIAFQPDEHRRDAATILTVNRMSAHDRGKNADQMIRAVAKLRAAIPNVRYVMIGDGVLRPELESLAESLGVSDIVDFRGWVSPEALQAAYAQATVFAMPSSKEGFGIVYLEAWQFGLPVICSDKGASKEVVSDGLDGFVVDSANVSMICDRLHILLTQPALAKAMGERGRRKVDAKFLDPNFQANLNSLIDELEPRTSQRQDTLSTSKSEPPAGAQPVSRNLD
ncbi:glycosyltransferase family 4 protein [Methylocapsa palsarum]|uniref:glycosyltransferase family 4 protein n=1 Tax=Methylocapsa palsarum TaxID=1612308 RepID=UPI001587B4D8|nr:glycosyltransferase family 4 protein [Methylocapsa palsarum]